MSKPFTHEELAGAARRIQESWDCGFLKDLLDGTELGEALPQFLTDLRTHYTAELRRHRPPSPAVGVDMAAKAEAIRHEIFGENHNLLTDTLVKRIKSALTSIRLEAVEDAAKVADERAGASMGVVDQIRRDLPADALHGEIIKTQLARHNTATTIAAAIRALVKA